MRTAAPASFITLVFILAVFLAACSEKDGPSTACTSSDDCLEAAEPYCSPDGACVECLDDEHCGAAQVCTADFVCEEPQSCSSSADCTDSRKEHCAIDLGLCVGCLDDDHCGEGQVCSADFTCEAAGDESCTSNADCKRPLREYCEIEDGVCVECLDDEHCGDESLWTCVENACVSTCGVEGFAPVEQEVEFVNILGLKIVLFHATAADDSILRMEFWGAPFETGTTRIQDNPLDHDYGTCRTCLLIATNCDHAGGNCDYFMAVHGDLVVDDIGIEDGDLVQGRLDDVVFREVHINWDSKQSFPVPNGRTWCIGSMEFKAYIDRECLSDLDCTKDGSPYCNDQGSCVECIEDTHCNSDEICADHTCFDVSFCHFEDFVSVQAFSNSGLDANEERKVVYQSMSAAGDHLWIELFAGASFEPGVTTIEDDPANQNYGTCSTCVSIATDCDEQTGACRYFYGVRGDLVIEAMGVEDGEAFEGRLENMLFQEVYINPDTYLSTPWPNARVWCVDEMAFSTLLNKECVDDTRCPEGRSHCRDDGVCVQCIGDEHCDGEGESCFYNICTNAILVSSGDGDTCGEAIAVEADATYWGTMGEYTNAFIPGSSGASCTGYTALGRDVVFEVSLEPGHSVNVVYTVLGADASIYIVSQCLDGEPPVDHNAVCLVGMDSGSNVPEQISYTSAEEQTVYVILDTFHQPSNPESTLWEAVFTFSP